MNENEELFETFKEEAKENFERVHDALNAFAHAVNRSELLDAVYRSIHTIKGSAGIFNLNELKDAAHILESKLSIYRKDPQSISEEVVNSLKLEVDNLEQLMERDSTSDLSDSKKNSNQGFHLFNEETNFTSSEANQLNVEKDAKQKVQEIIRVPIDRIQKNHDLTSEIFLIRNQISHLIEKEAEMGNIRDEFFLQWEILDNSLRQRIVELEGIALSMRMTSVKSLFSRMEKTVRSYCQNGHKSINIAVSGSETEIDKKILDSLGDPLIHLIRNAMDHGIELPHIRKEKGKSEIGTISLSASVQGNEAIIKISDDGKGIDINNILAVAKEKGMDVSRISSKQDAMQLIFAPGFSTAKEVNDVSGRGVGMDAVKAYIDKSGGRIHIETKIDKGTTFYLYLPIGLSVIPSIVIRVGTNLYGIPTHNIIQTYTMNKRDLSFSQDGHLVKIDKNYIEAYCFSNFLFSSESKDVDLACAKITVCIANIQGNKLAFVADSIEANTELIVKPLPKGCPSFPYLLGAAILANGDPAFILSLERFGEYILKRNSNYGEFEYAS